MNPRILTDWLQSENAIVRIRAARRLCDEKPAECLEPLRVALQKEGDVWVRGALNQALEAYEEPVQPLAADPAADDNDGTEIESQAISNSIGQVLHELEPVIGRLKVVASEVVQDYQGSALNAEFDKLDDLLATFENWRAVEQRANPKRLRFRDVVEKVVDEVRSWSKTKLAIELIADSDIEIETDEQLLRIIVSNALRNAVEATETVGVEPSPICISFGSTDAKNWLSIHDRGIGLPPNRVSILKSKVSTKPGNRGLGLAIIDKAVQSVGGNWDLRNGSAGGAEFYLEFPSSLK